MFYHSLMSSLSASSIIYLNNIVSPHIVHTSWTRSQFRANSLYCTCSFVYNLGDAEHVSNCLSGCPKWNTCTETATIHVSRPTILLHYSIILFPSHRATTLLKEDFHTTAGISLSTAGLAIGILGWAFLFLFIIFFTNGTLVMVLVKIPIANRYHD